MDGRENSQFIKIAIGVGVALLGCSVYSNVAMERRFARLEKMIAAGSRIPIANEDREPPPPLPIKLLPTSKPDPSLPTPPPPAAEPPPTSPRSMAARIFTLETKLDDRRYSRLRRFNDVWLKTLEDAAAGRIAPKDLIARANMHDIELKSLFGATPGAIEKYRQFIADLPGPHVTASLPDGRKFDAAAFE